MRRLLVVGLATALALAVTEAGLRLLSPQPLTGSWLTQSGRGYNVNKRSTFARHVQEGRAVEYRLNSLGLRGGEPSSGGLRVLAVGDSVTFGWLLNEPDTFVEQIAHGLDERFGAGRVHLLNGGVAGWGTADYTAFLEDSRDEIRPDAVIVFVGGDDVGRSWRSSIWQESGDQLVRAPVDNPVLDVRMLPRLPGYNFLVQHSHVAQLLRRTVVRASRRPAPAAAAAPATSAPDTDQQIARTRQLFRRLAGWSSAERIPLLVVSGPSIAIRSTGPRNATNAFIADAGAFFTEIGVPFLATEPFPANEIFAIPVDGHPNERGARIIADRVSPWLLDRVGELLAK